MQFMCCLNVGWLCWGLTSQSTIFQSCRDGAIASWVINQYFRGVKCLAQGHNTAAVGLEPRTSRSGVRHSTTEPPRSPVWMWFLLRNPKDGPLLVYMTFMRLFCHHLSCLMTKPTKWLCPEKTQISLGIHLVWSESLLCNQWVAKDPSFLYADSQDSDQTGRMPRLSWVFAGRTVTLLVLSWGGILYCHHAISMSQLCKFCERQHLDFVEWCYCLFD